MIAIWKFDLYSNLHLRGDRGTTAFRKIEMPFGAKILCAGVLNNSIHLWAECVTEAPKQERHFAIYGTGDPIRDTEGTLGKIAVNRKYIGTVFLDDNGPLVEHVFELI